MRRVGKPIDRKGERLDTLDLVLGSKHLLGSGIHSTKVTNSVHGFSGLDVLVLHSLAVAAPTIREDQTDETEEYTEHRTQLTRLPCS